MRVYKKSGFAVVVLAALAMLAAGCGSSSKSTKASDSTAATTKSESGPSPFSRAPKVRVMTIAPTNVGTWDPQQYLTYSKVSKEQGWDLQIAQSVPYGQAEQVLQQWGKDKVDVAFALDSGFGEAVLKVAPNYPETVYVVMSSLASTNNLPNVAAYAPNYCQMGYMAGAIQALSSKTGKTGVVSGLPVPAAKSYFEGAKQGVKATDPKASIDIAYSGDWTDAVKKAEAAAGLISKGADVISSFDTVPTATDQRVQSLNKKIVGIFADESKFAPEAVVTSVVINWKGYAETVEAVMNKTFKPAVHTFGFHEGMLDVLPAKDTALNGKIDAVKKSLADGSVKVTGGDCS